MLSGHTGSRLLLPLGELFHHYAMVLFILNKLCLKNLFLPEGHLDGLSQLVKRPTPGFSSGPDTAVAKTKPRAGLHADCGACLRFSISLCSCSLIKK